MRKDPSFVGMTNQKNWQVAAIQNEVNYPGLSSRLIISETKVLWKWPIISGVWMHIVVCLWAMEDCIIELKMAITRTRSYGPPSDGCIKLTISYKRDPLVFDSPPVTPGRDSPLTLKKRGDQQHFNACIHIKKITLSNELNIPNGLLAVPLSFL